MRRGTSCVGISKSRLEVDTRRLILTTASVIALGAGLTLAGTTQANAWSHHSGMKSSAMHVSRAEVTDIQQKLQAENLYQGRIDGMLGPQTRRALADYQKQNGLRVTANLDRKTRDSLLRHMGAGSPPSSATHMTPASSQGTAPSPAPAQGGTGTAPSGTNPAAGR
jgi:peptidoglycan hydrolase-like protein with peptidoglycan-binding domain